MSKTRKRTKEDELFEISSEELKERNKEIINDIILHDIKVIGKNESQKKLIKSIKDNQITICSGKAGSGKTFVSLAYALSLLKKKNNPFQKIYLIKSVTTLKGEEIGFLKGSMDEKIEPFMWSYLINMEKMIDDSAVKSLLTERIIRPFPMAYARGASIDNSIIIVDECFDGNTKIIVMHDSWSKPKHIMFKKLPFYFNKFDNLKVLSYNHEKNINEYEVINSYRITKNKKIAKLKFYGSNNETNVTLNHPYAVLGDGNIIYKKVNELSIGDRVLKRKNKSGNHSILNNKNYDILLGFLLGEACLMKNKQWGDNIFRIRKQHSKKQHEYNLFCGTLYNIVAKNGGKSGFTGEEMSIIQTKLYYIDNDFLKSIYNKNKKRISYDIKKYITVRTLATWFMDNGSNNIYNKNGSNIVLHSEGFTLSENSILKNILLEKFNLNCSIETIKKKRKDRTGENNYYYVLSFDNENSLKLQNLIKEYVHPSMYYKLNIKYRDFFQQQNYFVYKNYYDITTSILVDKIIENEKSNVYNIEVSNNNNYYANNILVHNCQNVTLDNARTILTRIGDNSKMILLGDVNQIDLKNKTESSLDVLLKMFEQTSQIGTVKMDDKDTNIRNPIIDVIEKEFDNYFLKKS